eukprot:TRINITY_DN29790_c0_g1_i1.p1 TRINITY_DN29790_c0_g1~~TRINITY_DN29790_c0_g1_i1.p1  ORF type:complete len:271 (+),score=33.58 TRINITY_DN29790_c0_g1_i1:102-914(+)
MPQELVARRLCEDPPDFSRSRLLQLLNAGGLSHFADLFRRAELFDRHISRLGGSDGYEILKDIGIPTAGSRLDLQTLFGSIKETEASADHPIDEASAIRSAFSKLAVLKEVTDCLSPDAFVSLVSCNSSWQEDIRKLADSRNFLNDRVMVTQTELPGRKERVCSDGCWRKLPDQGVKVRWKCDVCQADGLQGNCYHLLRSEMRSRDDEEWARFYGSCQTCDKITLHYGKWEKCMKCNARVISRNRDSSAYGSAYVNAMDMQTYLKKTVPE